MVLRQESVPWALIYSSWARCRVCTRVWPRYSGEKQIPRCPRDDTGARGHRAGGSEDPPLQLKGAEIGMAELAGNAAVAAIDKHERTQRGTVLGAIGGHGSLQKERLDFGIFGESRGGETHF